MKLKQLLNQTQQAAGPNFQPAQPRLAVRGLNAPASLLTLAGASGTMAEAVRQMFAIDDKTSEAMMDMVGTIQEMALALMAADKALVNNNGVIEAVDGTTNRNDTVDRLEQKEIAFKALAAKIDDLRQLVTQSQRDVSQGLGNVTTTI